MPHSNPVLSFSHKYKLLIITCLALTAFAASARAVLKSGRLPVSHTSQATPAQRRAQPAPAQAKKEVLPSEDVTITQRGFEPQELTRPAGRFFLSVENRSGQRGLTLIIDPEQGERIREFTQPEDALDWIDELQLTPGRYTLTTREQPNWVCHITVTPQ